MVMNKYLYTSIVMILCSFFGTTQERMTYRDVIHQLVDLERLAVLPTIGEKAGQWSSYDRRSRYDTTTNMYLDWSANDDGQGFIRLENGKKVLAEMEGPGVIWRIWTAPPGEGRLMIYLDESEKPVLEFSFMEMYMRWGRYYGYPNLVYRAGRSFNFCIPIPYQKSCKIIADPNWREYYNIGYTTYPKGTLLPKFEGEFDSEASAALEHVNRLLGNRGNPPHDPRPGEKNETKQVTVGPGETITIFQAKGTRAITSINVTLHLGNVVTLATLDREARVRKPLYEVRELPNTPEDRDVLRELVLAMYWDGEKHPSVWSPLGDFFGTAPGWKGYRSLPMGMTKDRLYSHWYMPFEKGAIVTLSNDGEKPRTLTFNISHAPVILPIQTLGRFHAKWHRDAFPPDDPGRRELDWTLLKTEGKGRFCGTMLHVNNPLGGWWGEGDEKFFVDNEKFPSVFGTGMDGYFGMWANHFPFYEAFHAHTLTDREMLHKGHECMNRWHIADNIPFQESFEAAFGKMFSNARPTLYAATVYWYLEAGGQDVYESVSEEDRIGYWPKISKFGITNTLEGEDLNIVSCTGGTAAPQHVAGLQTGAWSGLRGKVHLWWNGVELGDILKLDFPVERDDDYKLRMQFIKGDEYGCFQLLLDNHILRDSLDLSHRGLIPSGPVDLGVHDLRKGRHTLELIAIGTSSLVSNACQFGLDYLQLEAWDGSRNPEPKAYHVHADSFKKIYGPTSDTGRSRSINDHCFIRGPNGIWHFFGIGGWPGFAHGTAKTLLQQPWEKQPSPFPVEWDPWKEVHLWAPHIVKYDTYYMFYCAGSKDGATFRMHLATSPDLWNWTKHRENPLFVDGFDGRDPIVLRVGNKWVMYYCATSEPTGGNHVVAYRVSEDLIHWSERQIAFVDPGRHKAGGPTESPFVVRRGDTYYLFIGPREGYVGTDVFASKDPFRWYLEDRVGHIDSHAAEIVRDEDGRWYVSHAGSGQGGLYLAPLYWNDGLDEADTSIPVPGIEIND